MVHRSASLTPKGRMKLAQLTVADGWSFRRAAERFQVSPATAENSTGRYRTGESMEDRSSCLHTSPSRTPPQTEQRTLDLRQSHQWGPHRIGHALGVPRSTCSTTPEVAGSDGRGACPSANPCSLCNDHSGRTGACGSQETGAVTGWRWLSCSWSRRRQTENRAWWTQLCLPPPCRHQLFACGLFRNPGE